MEIGTGGQEVKITGRWREIDTGGQEVIIIPTNTTMASCKIITIVGRGMVGEFRMVGLTTVTILGRLHTASPMILASHLTTAS